MRKLLLCPNSSGYSVALGNEIISVATDGGFSRSRRNFLGAPSMVSVAWMLDEQGFDYLNAFFRTATGNGSLPFLCDLLIDRPTLREHTCKFVPGSFKPVASTEAFRFNAVANFEVLPIAADTDEDLAILDYYEETGGIFDLAYRLSRVVNVYLPGYFS